ncbi:MAG: aldehyde dehydrogenase [Phycisphaerae bacterium]
MTQVDEKLVRDMVEQVLEHVQSGWGGRTAPKTSGSAAPAVATAPAQAGARPAAAGQCFGQFTDVNEAVEAAAAAQRSLIRRSLAQRKVACDLIRQICVNRADELGEMEYQETKIGHRAHKPEKLRILGDLAQGVEAVATDCFSGDHGITLEERGPWGVIGVITPVTHSLPTLANNAVNMIAAGNSLVCNPHPGGKGVAAYGAKLFNQAIYEKLGIDNLVCVITEPTIESAQEIFRHPGVGMLAITGGEGVVRAAMASGKRAVCAGPGNPPVVVDESADLSNAARCIIEGAAYDNNLLCLSEKEAFVVAEVFDAFMDQMQQHGAYRLSSRQMDDLAAKCIQPGRDGGHPVANRQFVGAEPQTLAEQIGVNVPDDCRLLYGETKADHALVEAEQMMPLLPVVKCDSFEQAVDRAKHAEHGFRHTAVIHSRLVDHMTHMGKEMDTALYVKNGPSLAGDGLGGEGYGNFSIACSTGEGVVTPMTFTRFRRCVMVDNLRIV